MAAHPEHSIPRTRAVNETRRYYPASEFEKESLARVAEAGVSASLDQKDKLLGAIYKMFSAYGNAQLNQESAVLNRIKLCARLRLPGRPGYHKFDEAAKACRHMHILSDHYRNMADGILYDRSATPPPCSREKLQEAENKFKESCKQLQGSGYSIVGGKDVSYLIAEKEIIKCIEAELRDIEKSEKSAGRQSRARAGHCFPRQHHRRYAARTAGCRRIFAGAEVLCRPNKSNAERKNARRTKIPHRCLPKHHGKSEK